MITENVKDYTHLSKDHKGVFGQMVYTYTSPTHWGSDGLCQIRVSFWGELKDAEVDFTYSAGGWNAGFTNLQIAEAMKEAFALAEHRLAVLDKCPWQAKVAV